MIDHDDLVCMETHLFYLDGIPYTGCSKHNVIGVEYVLHYEHGVLHCADGPALINESGNEMYWYRHGLLHREDGPAIVQDDGYVAWYILGEKISMWEEYHSLCTLSKEQQMIVKLKYGEQLL